MDKLEQLCQGLKALRLEDQYDMRNNDPVFLSRRECLDIICALQMSLSYFDRDNPPQSRGGSAASETRRQLLTRQLLFETKRLRIDARKDIDNSAEILQSTAGAGQDLSPGAGTGA